MSSNRQRRSTSSQVESQQMKMLYRTAVTGLSHHNYAWNGTEIAVGDELEIEAITTNGFDSEAIAVKRNGEQIGWLSNSNELRAAKGIIHRMLRNELDLRVKVISHDKDAPLERRLYIGVYIRVAG